MAELVDALGSGPNARKGVEVRVFFWAPVFLIHFYLLFFRLLFIRLPALINFKAVFLTLQLVEFRFRQPENIDSTVKQI